MDEKKTHVEVAEPTVNVRYLADYMAGSERKKRAIAEACKYRPIARLIQHNEAKAAIGAAILAGPFDVQALKDRAKFIRDKMAADDHEALTNEANADYVHRFAMICGGMKLPNGELSPGKQYPAKDINGVKVAFKPNLMVRRPNQKTNAMDLGAIMFRYAKGKALPPLVADYQSAAILGILADYENGASDVPHKALCLTFDGYTGTFYKAPGAAVSMWANMQAACAYIAERWPNIKPPKNSIL